MTASEGDVPNTEYTPLYKEAIKMKTSGTIRKIDQLGRIVVPKSMCKALHIEVDDELDVTMEGERIILQKRCDGCVFCNSTVGLVIYNGRRVCAACVQNIKSMD
jgi:transcriptional pleiotropic regulator of transition state genes